MQGSCPSEGRWRRAAARERGTLAQAGAEKRVVPPRLVGRRLPVDVFVRLMRSSMTILTLAGMRLAMCDVSWLGK
eukprot:5536829-Pleurochrysis_carterae.AAC.1